VRTDAVSERWCDTLSVRNYRSGQNPSKNTKFGYSAFREILILSIQLFGGATSRFVSHKGLRRRGRSYANRRWAFRWAHSCGHLRNACHGYVRCVSREGGVLGRGKLSDLLGNRNCHRGSGEVRGKGLAKAPPDFGSPIVSAGLWASSSA